MGGKKLDVEKIKVLAADVSEEESYGSELSNYYSENYYSEDISLISSSSTQSVAYVEPRDVDSGSFNFAWYSQMAVRTFFNK